jgi:hypothetical protein
VLLPLLLLNSDVQCVAAGWSFPWGLRVRLCEMLLLLLLL